MLHRQTGRCHRNQHLGPRGLVMESTKGTRGALRTGKAGPLLRAVRVSKDRNLVVGGERALDGVKRVVHFGITSESDFGRSQRDRQRRGITVKSLSGSAVLFS